MKTRSIIMPVFTASRSLGDNPPNTEPERLPPPIRSDFDWSKDSVLRHAARVGK